MEQLHYGWCNDQESPKGVAGLQLQASSPGIDAREANELVRQYCAYADPGARRVAGESRIAMFRRAGDAVVTHTSFFANPQHRLVYFVHLLSDLPQDTDALKVLCCWKSQTWLYRPEPSSNGVLRCHASWPDAGPNSKLGVFEKLLNPKALQAAEFLVAALQSRTVDQAVVVIGDEDAVVEALHMVFTLLPASVRKSLTFSTDDDPLRSNFTVIGVRRTTDPARRALDLYSETTVLAFDLESGKSNPESLESVYAKWIAESVKSSRSADIIKLLDTYDVFRLESLSEIDGLVGIQEAEATNTDDWRIVILKLGSPKLGRFYVNDGTTMDSMLDIICKRPAAIVELLEAVQGSAPKWDVASGLSAGIASALHRRLVAGKEIGGYEKPLGLLFEGLGKGADLVWSGLFVLVIETVGKGQMTPTVSINITCRLWLLEKWQAITESQAAGAFAQLASCWLEIEPHILPNVLQSQLSLNLKIVACGAASARINHLSDVPPNCWDLLLGDRALATTFFRGIAAHEWLRDARPEEVRQGLGRLAPTIVSSLGWKDCREAAVLTIVSKLFRKHLDETSARKLEEMNTVASFLTGTQLTLDSVTHVLEILRAARDKTEIEAEVSTELRNIAEKVLRTLLNGASFHDVISVFPKLCGAFGEPPTTIADQCFAMIVCSPETHNKLDLVLGVWILCSALGVDRLSRAPKGIPTASLEAVDLLLRATRNSSIPREIVSLLAQCLSLDALITQGNGAFDLLMVWNDTLRDEARERLENVNLLRKSLSTPSRGMVDFSAVLRICDDLQLDFASRVGDSVIGHLLQSAISSGKVSDLVNAILRKPPPARHVPLTVRCLIRQLIALDSPRSGTNVIAYFISACLGGIVGREIDVPANAISEFLNRLREGGEALPRDTQREIEKAVRKLPQHAQELWGLAPDRWDRLGFRRRKNQ